MRCSKKWAIPSPTYSVTASTAPIPTILSNSLSAVCCATRQATVATAESCTGGLIAARLTDAPGSSDFFIAGYVTYTDAQKHSILGIPQALLDQHTAVSEPVAAAMAEAARRLSGATYGVASTGYAGPSGGTETEPVGTIYLAIAAPGGTRCTRLRYGADRYRNRTLATQTSLDLLRKTIQSEPAAKAPQNGMLRNSYPSLSRRELPDHGGRYRRRRAARAFMAEGGG